MGVAAAKSVANKKDLTGWRILQILTWLIGFGIFFCLVFYPSIGVILFWNILIPVAPLLIVLAVGVWRNVCPLASVNLLPRHFGFSKGRIMSASTQAKLGLISVLLLYFIVPLRHAVFNTNGHATAWLLFGMTITGLIMGTQFEWKSAWCSTLCPIHPVERLYGNNVLGAVKNAHCAECMNCVLPCPDSTPNMNPRVVKRSGYASVSGLLITGGLPGFVWGWFHVPDQHAFHSPMSFLGVYEMPVLGLAVTLSLYTILLQSKLIKESWLVRIFATAAVSCYYWYRIPSLLGFGIYTGDGMLFDAHGIIAEWIVSLLPVVFTLFFIYFLLIRKPNKKSWLIRPAFALRSRAAS